LTGLVQFEQGYQRLSMESSESGTIARLAQKDELAFEQVFKTHFKSLHGYALAILKDESTAEEMVQNVFFKLWDRADAITITGSIAAYLYRAVHNESLNFIKHQKVKRSHQAHTLYQMRNEADIVTKTGLKELEKQLHKAMNELPEQCRTIFQLSRFEELKYREIADQLDISVKTVENQMGKALRLLRVKLVDFLPFTIFLLIHF
jgi:RNA polymerase sigma-70 factor, ECF subfamily